MLATLMLALPDIRQKQGRPFSPWMKNALLVGNLLLASLNAGFNVLGSIYGPVSIVLPTIQSSILLFNMIIFGAVMGIDDFNKKMIMGTLVMTTAAVLLPVVGPTVQNNQDIEELLMKPLSLTWYGALLFVMAVSGILVMVINLEDLLDGLAVILLLPAQVSSKVVTITVAKTFVIVDGSLLIISCGVWSLGCIFLIYTVYKQATVVQQSTYVPLMVSSVLVVNALTGIIIWEDWKVINSWIGYICVFVLFLIGNNLVSDANVDLLGIENKKYGIKETFHIMKETFCKGEVFADERSEELIVDQEYQQKALAVHLLNKGTTGYVSVGSHSQTSRDAWKSCFHRSSEPDTINIETSTGSTSEVL